MIFFKELIRFIQPFAIFAFGWGIGDLIITGDYKSAAWILFSVSIFFIIGYFTERFSECD